METALYDRDHGYYRNSHIGKAGDFFTSVSVGPLFGQMLAYYLAKELAGLSGAIHIVEAGANDGSLAADILSWLAANRPEFAARADYCIVEPIAQLQERQREKLSNFNVTWVDSIDALPPICGAIISNELLDAFPVHVFRWQKQEQQWREFGVNSDFEFAPMSALAEWSISALSELKPLEPYLPDQFTAELCPAAEDWWRRAAGKLKHGLIIAFDYGDEASALWSPARAQGTLRAYRNHEIVTNVLDAPGEQDITASVNFTRIRKAGEEAGLTSAPLQSQAQFLMKIAAEFFTNPAAKDVRQFQTLTHPDHLGRAFKVLVQSRTSS